MARRVYDRQDLAQFRAMGSEIRRLRLNVHHLSQSGLGRRVGYSRETISQIERGFRPPSPECFKRIMTILQGTALLQEQYSDWESNWRRGTY